MSNEDSNAMRRALSLMTARINREHEDVMAAIAALTERVAKLESSKPGRKPKAPKQKEGE